MPIWPRFMPTMNLETIFLDTSGFIAILNSHENTHAAACKLWEEWNTDAIPLCTSNYIVIETTAVIQHRLGMQAVNVFHSYVLAPVHVAWISEALHEAAVRDLIMFNRRQLSLVDCTSFTLMRALGLRSVFTFDPHFAGQGFTCYPKLSP